MARHSCEICGDAAKERYTIYSDYGDSHYCSASCRDYSNQYDD